MLLPLLGLGALAVFLVTRARGKPSAPVTPGAPGGLEPGSWYAVVVRSSFGREAFGDDGAGQPQAFLGRQGFDARHVVPNANGDPYVYTAQGVYRGAAGGHIETVPGLIVIDVSPWTPVGVAGLEHVDERPVSVTPGVYFGRASISWPASMFVTRELVAEKLGEYGFSDVAVYMSPSELPSSWPATERGGDLFARATYNGAPRVLSLPSQIVSVWRQG